MNKRGLAIFFVLIILFSIAQINAQLSLREECKQSVKRTWAISSQLPPGSAARIQAYEQYIEGLKKCQELSDLPWPEVPEPPVPEAKEIPTEPLPSTKLPEPPPPPPPPPTVEVKKEKEWCWNIREGFRCEKVSEPEAITPEELIAPPTFPAPEPEVTTPQTPTWWEQHILPRQSYWSPRPGVEVKKGPEPEVEKEGLLEKVKSRLFPKEEELKPGFGTQEVRIWEKEIKEKEELEKKIKSDLKSLTERLKKATDLKEKAALEETIRLQQRNLELTKLMREQAIERLKQAREIEEIERLKQARESAK